MNIVEGFFVGNLGDDLFLYILGRKFPQQHFYITTTHELIGFYQQFGSFDLYKYPVEKKLSRIFPPRVLANIYNMLHGRNDNYILLGGSVFMDHQYSKQQYHYRKFDLLTSKRAYVIGSNFGPVVKQPLQKWYAKLLPHFDWVSWRDKASFDLQLTKTNQNFFPDVVLGLDTEKINLPERSPYMIINIMDLPDIDFSPVEKETYIKQLCAIATSALKKGLNVDLVSIGGKADTQVAANMKNKYFLTNKSVSLVGYKDIQQILEEFKGAKEVIATRYHAMILAWVFERPVHVYTYSSKTRNFISSWLPSQTSTNIKKIEQHFSVPTLTTIKHDDLVYLKEASKQHFSDLTKRFDEIGRTIK